MGTARGIDQWRCNAAKWFAAALLLVGSSWAQASVTGCLPSVSPNPVVVQAGDTAQFFIDAVEFSPGSGNCSSMSYSIAEVSDTTFGSSISSSTTGSAFFMSTPALGSVSTPSPPFGGGQAVYSITCTLGCEDAPVPARTVQVTVQLQDFVEVSEEGGAFQSSPTGVQFAEPLRARVFRNGTPSGGEQVTWTGTSGLELNGSGGPGPIMTMTDGSGFTQITAIPNLGSDFSHSVDATTPDVSNGTGTTFFNLDEIHTGDALTLVTPIPGTVAVGDSFPVTVRAFSNAVAVGPGEPIEFYIHNSFSECTDFSGPGNWAPSNTVTDSSGAATSTLTFTSEGSACIEITWPLIQKSRKSGPGPKGGFGDARTIILFVDVAASYNIMPTSGFPAMQTIPPAGVANLSVDLQISDGVMFNPVGSGETIEYSVFSAPSSNWQFIGQSPGTPIFPSTDLNSAAAAQFTATDLGTYVVKATYFGSGGLRGSGTGVPPVDFPFTVIVANTLVANDDDFTGSPINGGFGGTTASVIANDTFNGSPMSSTQVTLSIQSDGGLSGVTIASTGELDIPSATPAGNYTVGYEVCDAMDSGNCDQANALVAIVATPIDAVNDDFTGSPINGAFGGSTASVLDNDEINNEPIDPIDAVLTIVSGGGLTPGSNLAINTDGTLDISSPVAPGDYGVVYQLCEAANPTNCDTATALVRVIASPIDAVNDDFSGTPIDADTGGSTASVLANDLLNNEPVSPSDVSLSILSGGGLTPGSNLTVSPTGQLTIIAPVNAGTHAVTYQICEMVNPSNCDSATATVVVVGGVVRALDVVSGSGQSGPPGSTPDPLVVLATDDGVAVGGEPINWSVNGPATIAAAQTVTNGSGQTSNSITFTDMPGTVTVTARRGADQNVTAVFTLVSADPGGGGGQPLLVVRTGNLQTGIAGTRADDPLVVQIIAGQGPLIGQLIGFEVLAGGAVLDADSAITDNDGNAIMGFSFGPTPGPVQIRVFSEVFNLEVISTHVATGAVVDGISGNNQSGPPGEPLALEFGIQVAPAVAKALGHVQVDWEVVSGGGTLRESSSFTDDGGTARNLLTLGPQPGMNVVQATLPGGATVQFVAEGVIGNATLSKVSGDNQIIPTNDPSAPLVVQLLSGSGAPVAGATITWSPDSNAVVDPSTSVTDANGRAQTIAQVLVPGSASVTASAAETDADPVVFAVSGGVRNISILDPEERGVGAAVDGLCPALAALPSRTPEEEDLFQRCSEFVDNAGDNPEDVRNALRQIPTEVADTITNSGQGGLDAQFDNIGIRFLMLHDEQRGGRRNQFNIGLWTPTGMVPLGSLASLAADGEDNPEAGLDFDRWGFFATGQIGRGESDAT